MDGFNDNNKGILVLAATNNQEFLDPALLRKGRIDRTVKIPMPNQTDREEILNIIINKIKHNFRLNIPNLAKQTVGFSGADLANLVNEASIMAINKGHTRVEANDFDEAFTKITLGEKDSTLQQSDLEKRTTAYHEAGHAIASLFLPYKTKTLYSITINNQGRSLGHTQFSQINEISNYSKECHVKIQIY